MQGCFNYEHLGPLHHQVSRFSLITICVYMLLCITTILRFFGSVLISLTAFEVIDYFHVWLLPHIYLLFTGGFGFICTQVLCSQICC